MQDAVDADTTSVFYEECGLPAMAPAERTTYPARLTPLAAAIGTRARTVVPYPAFDLMEN